MRLFQLKFITVIAAFKVHDLNNSIEKRILFFKFKCQFHFIFHFFGKINLFFIENALMNLFQYIK